MKKKYSVGRPKAPSKLMRIPLPMIEAVKSILKQYRENIKKKI